MTWFSLNASELQSISSSGAGFRPSPLKWCPGQDDIRHPQSGVELRHTGIHSVLKWSMNSRVPQHTGLDLKNRLFLLRLKLSLPSHFHKKSLAAEMSFGAHNCDLHLWMLFILAVSSDWRVKCVQCENAGFGGGLHVGQGPEWSDGRESYPLCWYQILRFYFAASGFFSAPGILDLTCFSPSTSRQAIYILAVTPLARLRGMAQA